MYKKSWIHLSGCMINDDLHPFKFNYRCTDDSCFYTITKDKEIKHSYDELGFPISKVYEGKKHIMTFEMGQSRIYSDIELEINNLK